MALNESVKILSARELVDGAWPEEAILKSGKFFAEHNYLVIADFFDSFLLQHINQLIEKSDPEIFHEADEGPEHSKGHIFLKNRELQQFPNMLLNNKNILRFFKAITGLDHLKFIGCYPYRSQQEDRHAMHWHQDMIENKIFVISINLSREPYEGGEFALRYTGQDKELLRISNTSPGSMIIARIGNNLEHCTTKVTGTNPRLTLAGWGFSG